MAKERNVGFASFILGSALPRRLETRSPFPKKLSEVKLADPRHTRTTHAIYDTAACNCYHGIRRVTAITFFTAHWPRSSGCTANSISGRK